MHAACPRPTPVLLRFALAVFFRLAAATVVLLTGFSPALPAADPSGAPAVAASAKPPPRADRFLSQLRRFLGVPYQLGPLGEGSFDPIDPKPLLDLTRFDCVTLLETALALTIDAPEDSLAMTMARIRYRDGKIAFLNRNHFFVPDWIPANAWLVEDVTAKLGGAETKTLTRTVGRQRFLAAKKISSPSYTDETFTTDVIPVKSFAQAAACIREPLIIVFVGKVDWLFALHTGAVYRNADGELVLLHASSKRGKVAEEDLMNYLEGTDRYVGIKLLAIRD